MEEAPRSDPSDPRLLLAEGSVLLPLYSLTLLVADMTGTAAKRDMRRRIIFILMTSLLKHA